MRINPQNLTSFTSIPLYKVNLKKQNSDGTTSNISATFSKLERYDGEDRTEMRKLSSSWAGTQYGEKIAKHFLGYESEYDDDEFFAIESTTPNGARNIYSISQVNPITHLVSYLQSNPKNKMRGIKGAGEVMLWGIGRELRQDVNGGYFHLYSSPGAIGFYRQAELTSDNSFFYVDQNNGPQFFSRLEEKYGLNAKNRL